jgi:hypothetical protein
MRGAYEVCYFDGHGLAASTRTVMDEAGKLGGEREINRL